MSHLVFLSILSISCWLNLSHGMSNGEESEAVEEAKEQVSATPEPIYNLDYDKDQQAFLGKLVPIAKKHPSIFTDFNDRVTRKQNGHEIVYSPKFKTTQKADNYFGHIKNEINKALSQQIEGSEESKEDKEKLVQLKNALHIYFNPKNGLFKASQIHQILEDSGYSFIHKTRKRKSKTIYNGSTLKENAEKNEIISLTAEKMRHIAGEDELKIGMLFNPAQRLNDENLKQYYKELDKKSDEETKTTLGIMNYALAYICNPDILRKYARLNSRQDKEKKEATKQQSHDSASNKMDQSTSKTDLSLDQASSTHKQKELPQQKKNKQGKLRKEVTDIKK